MLPGRFLVSFFAVPLTIRTLPVLEVFFFTILQFFTFILLFSMVFTILKAGQPAGRDLVCADQHFYILRKNISQALRDIFFKAPILFQ